MIKTSYFKLDTPSLLYDNYIIIDAAAHLAENAFTGMNLKFRLKREIQIPGDKYCFRECLIRKGQEGLFFKALETLENHLIIRGYSDYREYCEYMHHALLMEEQALEDYN